MFDFSGYGLDEHWIIDAIQPALDEVVNPVDVREFAIEPPSTGAISWTYRRSG